MRRPLLTLFLVFTFVLTGTVASSQQDPLEGRWEGTAEGPQGQQAAVATFKKSGNTYTGTITGRGNTDMAFRDIKVDGNKITAEAAPEGAPVVIKYSFALEGETLKGKGEVEFGGQTYTFNYNLKRTAAGAQAAAPGQQPQGQGQGQGQGGQGQGQRRPTVPQPQQKQSIDYFVGQWSFKWIGRESPLGPGGTLDGTLTFTRSDDSKFLDSQVDARGDDGALKVTGLLGFDEERKVVITHERRNNGVEILGLGDWNSPIAIRYSIAPIKLKGQTLKLRRIVSVVSAHSFTMTEELSENGGPFVRLGNGVFSKVPPPGSTN